MHCSDVEVEPLPGTAKPGSTYVLFEWPDAWSRDVLDGDTFGEALSSQIKDHVERYDASFLLIRHATRERRQIGDHHVYLVFADKAVIEVLHVDGPEALLTLDLSGPGKNAGASIRTKPLLLVCTHAKRDQCCAIKGRPLVRQLQRSDDMVWETSHIKGHRFAPTMLLMPWAVSYGRMNEQAARAMLEHAEAGLYFVPGNRGRGTLPAPAQAAEIAVASELSRAGVAVGMEQLLVDVLSTDPTSAHVNVTDTTAGGTYTVALHLQPVEGVVDSCGKEPKIGSAWVVDAVEGPRA